ncbi:MAG: choline transporter [Gammaproteobacteria bacterium SG8_15]|nr:MAG: choline transporter [Gammaproteobacteria bacterium SG8_15]
MNNWIYRRGDRVLLDLNPWVFLTSSSLILFFVVASFMFVDELDSSFSEAQAWIANQTGWFFVLATNLILAFMFYLAIGRFSGVRLGGQDSKPEFSRIGWFAMLFSAGMGIGLMFYSIAEPMYHLLSPPHGAEPRTVEAAEDAMKTTFLHWGLHAWGIYSLVGLALAYFSFNRRQPFSIRAVFQPLLGDRVHGGWGHAIDIMATVATLFGVATSLGLGVSQINAGLQHLFAIPENTAVQIVLIVMITFIATLSVVAGLDRGIKRLSEINMIAALVLLIFVVLAGPSIFILNGFVENLGQYLNDFFYLGFWNETYTGGSWQNGWTVFYWGWWIAWSPFVGMFIARISRGRTIREFIAGVLLVPTLLTFFWLSVFGDSALYMELFGAGNMAQAVNDNLARSLFFFFDQLHPVSSGAMPAMVITAVSLLATLVVITFFVTSSDSGSLVIDMITAGGKANPPVAQRIFWASTEGAVAAALLIGGGLTALQTAAIITGLPFAVILVFMVFSLYRALSSDHH